MPEQISREEFYSPEIPDYEQQGDIVIGVPLPAFTPTDSLFQLESAAGEPLRSLDNALVSVKKTSVDQFDGPKFVAVSVDQYAVVIMTPTCDLKHYDEWQVCPIFEFEIPPTTKEQQAAHERVFELRAQNRFPIVELEGFYSDAYVDYPGLRSVPKQLVKAGSTVATLSALYQRELADHFVNFFGRFWGHDANETAPRDGLYACIRDQLFHDLKEGPQKPRQMAKGDPFEQCPNCKKIHKSSQFIRLEKHRKF